MLNREDDASTSAIQTFLGGNTGGGASTNPNPNLVGPLNMSVILDTRPAFWTVEWLVNGASIRGSVAFGSNPTINYTGIGA